MADLNPTIDQHSKNIYKAEVFRLTQQTAARTRPICDFEPVPDGEVMFLDRVGSVEVQNINGRSPEVVPSDLTWDRRMLQLDRVGVAFYMDKRDAQRCITEPNSIYAQRAAEAIERDLDRCVVTCLDAPVNTGKNGTVPLSAATDGMITLDATGGATYDVLLQMDANYQAYEIGIESPVKKYFLMTEQEHQQFMKEAELINSDYTDRKVVDQGVLKMIMDFNVILFGSKMPNPILPVTATVRNCFAVATGGVRVAAGVADIEWKDANGRWVTDQLLAWTQRGAVPMERSRIQKIQTTAT